MKLFIRVFSIYIFLFALIGCSPVSSAKVSSPDIKVYFNDELLAFPQQQPYFDYQNNRCYVPLRTISDALGASVAWDPKARLVRIQQAAKSIEISADSSLITINRQIQAADVQPVFQNGYTLVPLRFVSEALDGKVEWDEKSRSIRIYKYMPLKLISIKKPQGVFTPGDAVNISLELRNTGSGDGRFWVGYSLRSPNGKIYDAEPKVLELKTGGMQEVNLSREVPDSKELTSGSYDILLSVWDRQPADKAAQRLLSFEYPGQIKIYRYVEGFNNWDSSLWTKDTGKLGLSQLHTENVAVRDGHLFLIMPAKTTAGAEIILSKAVSYGSYEVSMKIPDSPSSITGFFLYRAPDLYNEIDIELYNSSKGKAMFTLYAGGRKSQAAEYPLSFDPTKESHSYRFDYLPDGVSFYVDDVMMQKWTDGFSTRPMKLMINTWYPDWLDGKTSADDKYVEVDWIRY